MNGYNPNIHHRKSIRLKGYDYSQVGLYFITICTQDRKCLFGKIENVEMVLIDAGMIANGEWVKLQERFTNFELDVFQIMPNHIHGIILLTETNVGAGFTPARNDNAIGDARATGNNRATARVAPTIGDIIGAYKSLVANECLQQFKLNQQNEMMGK